MFKKYLLKSYVPLSMSSNISDTTKATEKKRKKREVMNIDMNPLIPTDAYFVIIAING